LRVELAAARVTLGTVASSLAGTRTSCVKDVEPRGRRSSYKKIALPRSCCQHLRRLISGVPDADCCRLSTGMSTHRANRAVSAPTHSARF
jgi:hypothetical protein